MKHLTALLLCLTTLPALACEPTEETYNLAAALRGPNDVSVFYGKIIDSRQTSFNGGTLQTMNVATRRWFHGRPLIRLTVVSHSGGTSPCQAPVFRAGAGEEVLIVAARSHGKLWASGAMSVALTNNGRPTVDVSRCAPGGLANASATAITRIQPCLQRLWAAWQERQPR